MASRKRPEPSEQVVPPAAAHRTVVVASTRSDQRPLAGMVDWAGRHGWRLVNLGHFGFQMPPGVRPDGMLLHLGPQQRALARRLARICGAVVQVDGFFRRIDAPRVVSALRIIGHLAVEHFLQRGFMWDRLHRRLSVSDIAAAVGVSRRKLERRFRKHLDPGVNEELIRKRLERCCRLLETTDEPVARIARRIGFRSGEYLHAVFARTFGLPPRQCRLREQARPPRAPWGIVPAGVAAGEAALPAAFLLSGPVRPVAISKR